MLARQSDDGVRVRLEVEPPRGMALVPAVHRERDEVGAVFEVADDARIYRRSGRSNRRSKSLTVFLA